MLDHAIYVVGRFRYIRADDIAFQAVPEPPDFPAIARAMAEASTVIGNRALNILSDGLEGFLFGPHLVQLEFVGLDLHPAILIVPAGAIIVLIVERIPLRPGASV